MTRPRSRIAGRLAAHPTTSACLLAFTVFLAIALIQGPKVFYYDSSVYWLLSKTFSHDGHFSLLSFKNAGLRGYALPLIYYMLQRIAELFTSDESLMVMVFNSALFALIGGMLAPKLARIVWPELHWSIPRRLALCGLILVFWSGYLNFPLSDFPALAAAMLAIIAISAFDSPLSMLAAGAAAALALNMRSAYILLIPFLPLLVVCGWFEQRRKDHASNGRRALCLGLFAVGIVCVSLPQSLSQHDTFNSYNPIPGGKRMVGFQFTDGLRLQRYETYVGNRLVTPRMEYLDPQTDSIISDLPNESVSGTGEYIALVLGHPATMGGVFLRHIVNGLDLRYTTPYVEHLDFMGQRLLRFGGFLVVFLALLRIAWPKARRKLGPARWRYLATLLLTCATSLPSAIETRYLLPAFVLSSIVVVAQGWPSPIGPSGSGLNRYRSLAVMAAVAMCFFVIVWLIVRSASDNLRFA